MKLLELAEKSSRCGTVPSLDRLKNFISFAVVLAKYFLWIIALEADPDHLLASSMVLAPSPQG